MWTWATVQFRARAVRERLAACREEGLGLGRVAVEGEGNSPVAVADVVLEMKGDERVPHVLLSRFNED